MNKKEIATAFLKTAGCGCVHDAYEKYIAANFKHHNQYFKGDRKSLMEAMEKAHSISPNKSIDIKYTYQDGDTVITHSLVTRQDPTQKPIAVIHIFRFEGDMIAELWDLGQMIEHHCPNENGLF